MRKDIGKFLACTSETASRSRARANSSHG
ncbi:hypothetical protein [Parageobacillus thermoglucosidasius]